MRTPDSPTPACRPGAQRHLVPQLLTLFWLLLFFVLPWLRIDGQPVLMLDPEQRLLFFAGLQLDSRHAPAAAALLVAAAAGLYLITHLAGRLWCGYVCPQTVLGRLHTVWERRLGQRATSLLWALTATATGITFVGYFLPIQHLLLPPFDGWNGWSLFWAGFYALGTWANISLLKSRVCTELCPFARLQPWITDTATPHVQYQLRRGEPRGPRGDDLGDITRRGRRLLDPVTARDYVIRAANPELAGDLPRFAPGRLGDCTDCRQCLADCPMGLDIRNGQDARCIDCGNCQRACDAQMQARGYASGLIAYRPEQVNDDGSRQWWRPRTGIAASVLAAALVAAWWLA